MGDRRFSFSFSPPPSPMKSSSSWREGDQGPFIIGVAGGTASGKTSVCRKIMEALGQNNLSSEEKRVAIISQDSFYCDLSEEKRELAAMNEYNFDHPDAIDNELLKQTLVDVVSGKQVEIPVYDYKTHTRSKTEKKIVYPADVVLIEGILILYDPTIRSMMQMKLFVDSDSDTRLARRVRRDIQERGRTLDSVLDQYTTFVKPAFEEFTLPTKKYADVIIPRGVENDVAINLIVQHIQDILAGKIARVPQAAAVKKRERHSSESSTLARPH